MKSVSKIVLLSLFILFSFSVNAQENTTEDEIVCELRTHIILLNVSVWSNKKGYITDLTYKEFEVFDEKEFQEIEIFKFDESTNQYSIGFTPNFIISSDNKWHDVKIKLKLSDEKKKEYGKISIIVPKGYYESELKFYGKIN